MKFVSTTVLASLGLLGLCSATSNTTTVLDAAAAVAPACDQPGNAVTGGWYYDSWRDGPYYCTKKNDDLKWSMLRAYRMGGSEGTHWTYVDSGDESRCLTNWGYYSADGKTLKATIKRSTTMGDSRRWCALPVYRPGGIQGKQWQYCGCPTPWRPDPTMAK